MYAVRAHNSEQTTMQAVSTCKQKKCTQYSILFHHMQSGTYTVECLSLGHTVK